MAKAGRKTQDMRHVSFRMPADVYLDYIEVAESRGVDFSSLLNWVTVEYRPVLLLRRAELNAAMLRAAVADAQPGLPDGADMTDAVERVDELVRQLQELAAVLRKRSSGHDERRAA